MEGILSKTVTRTNRLFCSHSKKRIPKGSRITIELVDRQLNAVFCGHCPGCKRELHELELIAYEHSPEMDD